MSTQDYKNESRVVLMVEDDPEDFDRLCHALRDAGLKYELHHVRSGREALDYILGHGQYADREIFPYPHICLLDLSLDYMTGHDVLAAVKRRTELPRIAIVALGNSSHARDRDSALRLGACCYYTKTDLPEKLRELMQDIFAKCALPAEKERSAETRQGIG